MIIYKCDRYGKKRKGEMQKVGKFHLCNDCRGDYMTLRASLDQHRTDKLKEFFKDAGTTD